MPENRIRPMQAMDHRYGRGRLKLPNAGAPKALKLWAIRQERMSSGIQTEWRGLAVAGCGPVAAEEPGIDRGRVSQRARAHQPASSKTNRRFSRSSSPSRGSSNSNPSRASKSSRLLNHLSPQQSFLARSMIGWLVVARETANTSVKGTSCKPAAPYAER